MSSDRTSRANNRLLAKRPAVSAHHCGAENELGQRAARHVHVDWVACRHVDNHRGTGAHADGCRGDGHVREREGTQQIGVNGRPEGAGTAPRSQLVRQRRDADRGEHDRVQTLARRVEKLEGHAGKVLRAAECEGKDRERLDHAAGGGVGRRSCGKEGDGDRGRVDHAEQPNCIRQRHGGHGRDSEVPHKRGEAQGVERRGAHQWQLEAERKGHNPESRIGEQCALSTNARRNLRAEAANDDEI
eukprot:6191555-Pleurochrysis_carterae.AAC.2